MSRRFVTMTGLLAIAILAALAPGHASAWTPIDGSRPVWRLPVPYSMNNAGSADLGVAMTETIVRQGMDDWTRVSCTSLRTEYRGQVATRAGGGDGQSVIGWVESGWRHDSNAIGVTGPAWSFGGGGSPRIVEADMEMNGVHYTWITGSGRGSSVNAYSIVLHEGGHYYGLGHSSDSSATMYFAYTGGIDSLGADDQAGICALYPGSGMVDCTTTGCPSGQMCVSGSCVPAMGGSGDVCSPCSSSSDCTSGVCLRYPDGSPYCGRSCTSSAQCGSGDMCVSVTGAGGQCIRFSGMTPSCAGGTPSGCRSDADCSATQRCNTTTGACEARPTTGAELGQPCGAGTDCRSGLCFGGACSQTCDWLNPSSCPGGFYCNGQATGACGPGSAVCLAGSAGAGANGAACSAATECASLYCANGTCTTPCIPGGAATCAAGFACAVTGGAGCGACQRVGAPGDECDMQEDCASGLCAELAGDRFCTERCDDGAPCPRGFTCMSTGVAGLDLCVPDGGGLGDSCAVNEDCLSGICATEGDRRYCTRVCDDSTPCSRSFSCVPTADDALRVCQPRPSSGGCGCAVPGGGARGALGGIMGLVGVVLVLAGRRRKR